MKSDRSVHCYRCSSHYRRNVAHASPLHRQNREMPPSIHLPCPFQYLAYLKLWAKHRDNDEQTNQHCHCAILYVAAVQEKRLDLPANHPAIMIFDAFKGDKGEQNTTCSLKNSCNQCLSQITPQISFNILTSPLTSP